MQTIFDIHNIYVWLPDYLWPVIHVSLPLAPSHTFACTLSNVLKRKKNKLPEFFLFFPSCSIKLVQGGHCFEESVMNQMRVCHL